MNYYQIYTKKKFNNTAVLSVNTVRNIYSKTQVGI